MSNSFRIDDVGEAGQLVVIPKTSMGPAHWLGVNVSLAPPPFIRTKIVNIYARFNLVNDLPYDLWFVECGGKNWVKLMTQCRIAFDPQNVGLRGKPSLQISLVDPSTIPIRSTPVQKKKIVTSWYMSLDPCSPCRGIIGECGHEKDKNHTVAPLSLSIERERRRKRRPTNKKEFAEESTEVVMKGEGENDLQSIKKERRIEEKKNDEIVSWNRGSTKGIGLSASTVLANISCRIPTHSKHGRGNSHLKYLSCEFSISDLGTFQLRHASSCAATTDSKLLDSTTTTTTTHSGRGGRGVPLFSSSREGENIGRPLCRFVITQVDIRAVESASIFVRFSIPEKADFLLCNEASRQILFVQVGLRHAPKEILNAGEKCQYTWHDISGVRKLRFTIKDDRRRQISFNCAIARVKTHTKVVLGHHRLLYVVTGVEKDRRVVYISEDKKRFDLMRRNELPYRRLKGFRDLHHEFINISNRLKIKKKKSPHRRMQTTIGASRSQHKKTSAKNIQSPMMTTTALDKYPVTTTSSVSSSSVSSSNISTIGSEKRRRLRRRRRRLASSSLTRFKKGGTTDAVLAEEEESEAVVKGSSQIYPFLPPLSSVNCINSENDVDYGEMSHEENHDDDMESDWGSSHSSLGICGSQSLATDNSPQSTSSCSPDRTTSTSVTIDRRERCKQEDNPQKKNTQSLLLATTTTNSSKQVVEHICANEESLLICDPSSSTIVNGFGNPFDSMDNPSSQSNRNNFLITPAARKNSRMLEADAVAARKSAYPPVSAFSESEISQTSTEWNNDDIHNEESDDNTTISPSPRRTKERERHLSFRLNGKEEHKNDQDEKGKVMIRTSRGRGTHVVSLHPESSQTKRMATAATHLPSLSPTRSQPISSSRKKKDKMKTRRRLSLTHFETRPRIYRRSRVHKHSVTFHELPVSSHNFASATTRRQTHHDESASPLHDTPAVINTTRGSHFRNLGFRVEIFLSGCGVSLVNSLPSEVIYISISKVVVATRSSVGSSHTDFKLQIQNFQIDNRCTGAHSTTIVRPSTEEDFKRHGSGVKPSAIPWKRQKPSSYNSSRSVHTDVTPGERDVHKSPAKNAFKQLQPFLEWDCEEEEGEKIDIRGQCCSSPPLVQLNLGGVLGAEAAVLRYVVFELRPLTIHIEIDTAFELAEYFLHFLRQRSLNFRSLHTENIMFIRQSQRDPLSEGFRRLRDAPMPPPPAPALRYAVYIQTFIIDGTKFLVSARAPRIHRHLGSDRDTIMLRHFKFVGARLTTDVTNFPITFKCLIHQSLFTNPDQLLGELLNWYLQQTIRQIGKLVGSIDLLGNPLGFMSRVSEGLMELFRDPYEGMLKGPEAFLGGLGKGIRVFIVSILTGILDSLSQFTGSLFKVIEWGRACDGWELLAMWPEAIRADRVAIEQPDNVLDGIWRGAQGGLQIQGAALASIVMRPLQQYRQTGCLGLFSGFVVGIPTAVFGFIGGFLIFGQALFAGMRNSLTPTYQAESVRPPRVFGPNRIVSQYSPYDGLASELLFKYLKQDASSLPVVASFPLRWSPGSRRSLRKWQLRLQQRLSGVTPSPYERFFLQSSDYIIITPQLFIYFREGAMIWACRHEDVLQIELTVRLSPSSAADGGGDHQRELLPQKSERERECIIFELLHGVAVTSYNRILGATEPTLRLRVRNSMGQSYEFYRKRAPKYCKLCLQQQTTSEGVMEPLNRKQTRVERVILTNTIGSCQSSNIRNMDGTSSSKMEMDSTADVSNLAYLERKEIFSKGLSKQSSMSLPRKSKFK